MTVAQRTSELFAVSAKDDGKVLSIDNKLNLLKVQFKDQKIPTIGHLSVPYPQSVIDTHLVNSTAIQILVKPEDITKYPVGSSFDISKGIVATVSSFERVVDPDSMMGMDLEKTFKDLLDQLRKKSVDSLFLIYLTIRHDTTPGEIDVYRFGDEYSFVSGSYLRQPLTLNIKAGESFHRGDVLVYNSGFFDPDPYSKQVGWKHGVTATVALMEKGETLEDGCLISRKLGDTLKMSPAHTRTISFTNDTAIRNVLNVGDEVESTDLLCVLEEGDLDALTMSDDPESIAFLGTLSQKAAPRARYHGHIVDFQVFYSGDFEHLHPTIQDLVRRVEKKNRSKQLALRGTSKEGQFRDSTKVPIGLKYHGVDFDRTTVVVEFMILEEIACNAGDKLVVANANKSVISGVMEEPYYTKSGMPVDVLFAATSIMARIVTSPFMWGILTRISEKMESTIVEKYFSE